MAQIQQQQLLFAMEQQRQLLQMLQVAMDSGEAELRNALQSPVGLNRFLAAYAIGPRNLFWQNDLIPLLNDREEMVRQAARRSLIILGFLKMNPTVLPSGRPSVGEKLIPARDFGPRPPASLATRKKAIEDWTNWWREFDQKMLNTSTSPAEKSIDPLVTKLLRSTKAARSPLLNTYAKTEGNEYTLALALAIHSLEAEERKEARDLLVDRLADRKETTLLKYLTHEEPEIRRAAVLALAMRDAQETIEKIASLLLDPDAIVAYAAQISLKSLTGKDYGPVPNATQEEREKAMQNYLAVPAKK